MQEVYLRAVVSFKIVAVSLSICNILEQDHTIAQLVNFDQGGAILSAPFQHLQHVIKQCWQLLLYSTRALHTAAHIVALLDVHCVRPTCKGTQMLFSDAVSKCNMDGYCLKVSRTNKGAAVQSKDMYAL